MRAYIAQSLHDDAFAFQIAFQSRVFDVFRVVKKFFDAVKYPPSGCFHAPLNTALGKGFARCAGNGVDVFRVQAAIRVCDPGHFAFSSSHVGCGNVEGRIDISLFDQFPCKTPGDELEFVFVVFAGIDAQAPFGTAKWHIHNRAFVRHERGECFHVILADCGGVTNAAFDGQAMLTVNRAPSREDAIAVAEFDKEAHHVNVVVGFDLVGQSRGQIERCRCAVKHEVNAVPEGVFLYGHKYFSGKCEG